MTRLHQALAATTLSTLSLLTLCTVGAPVHASPTATSAIYTVRAGDYLTGIALKVGAKVGDLLEANHLKISSVIHPGDTLVLPAGAKLPVTAAPAATVVVVVAAAAAAAPLVYTVKRGESLALIARDHGVRLGALLAANKMTVTSVIHPGSTLSLPPATMPIPAMPTGRPASHASTVPSEATVNATVGGTAINSPQSKSITTLLSYLQAQVGKPYQFNGAGPDTFDCSGLVTAAFAKIGVDLPHQSLVQSTYGVAVDWKTKPIMPGDLVFMYSSASPGVIGHVGVAIDSKTWIQAARTGTPVRIGPMPSPEKIQAVRRIIKG